MSLEAIVIQAGEGKALSLRGTQVAYKAEGERPGGGPTSFSNSLPSRGSIRAITSTAGSRRSSTSSKASSRFVPASGPSARGRASSCWCRRGWRTALGMPPTPPAKMVLLISPAGLHERYFEELSAILSQPGPPDVQAVAD